MIYLFLSVVFSVLVSVLLKVARAKQISFEVAIAINYLVALTLTFFVLSVDLSALVVTFEMGLIILALSILLPTIFIVMGYAVRYAGIIKSDVAQRLALVIPIVASFTILGETLQTKHLFGLPVAFTALLLLLHRPRVSATVCASTVDGGTMDPVPKYSVDEGDPKVTKYLVPGLLMLVWVGYGSVDILFKQMSKLGSQTPTTLFLSFVGAGVVLWTMILVAKNIPNRPKAVDQFVSKIKFNKASILGGLLLGGLNFGNILFYIWAHQAMKSTPSIVFAGMNMGVISLGTILGAVLFKEKISGLNALGVFMALLAIYLLIFWI